jgi:hypothetical protein
MVLANRPKKNKPMKKITTLLFLLIGLVSFSQSNLTIFNNGGQQFYVILNGIKQNSVPMTNVSVGGIKNGSYSVKMIFADGKTADIDKNFFIDAPSDITTRVIFKKGIGKLQLIGMEPTSGVNTTQGVILYRPDNSAVYSDAVTTQTVTTQQTTTTTNSGSTNGSNGNDVTINQSGNTQSGTSQNGSVNMSGTTNTTNTNANTNGQTVNQTITVTDPNNPNGNVGMNVSINVSDPQMGGENVNMSVNMNGMGTGSQTNTTNTSNQSNQGNTQYSQNTTVTTTTTTTTSGTQTNTNNTAVNTNNTNVNTSTNANHPVVTCKNIMNDENTFITEMNSIMMDDEKTEFILSQLTNFCLTASQAYKITEVLKFEDDRLIVAKFLYDRMIDKDKSNSLLPLFKFDDSKMEYAAYSRK